MVRDLSHIVHNNKVAGGACMFRIRYIFWSHLMKTSKALILLILLSVAFTAIAQPRQTQAPRNRYAIQSADTVELLMNEYRFWGIIMEARTAAKGNYRAQISNLERLLFTLEPQEIEQFDNRFMALMDVAYDNRLWGAAYLINGGCSEDCFDYFRQYLISQGRERFYTTLQDPETCSAWIRAESQESWEGLLYVAGKIYKMKTGFEIPCSYSPEFELKGEAFNEATVASQYPKLAKKFVSKK